MEQSINSLCAENNLDRNIITEMLKDAAKAAVLKQFKNNGESIQVDWNNEEGMIEISIPKEVVAEVENSQIELSLEEAQQLAGEDIEIGDMLLIPLPTEDLHNVLQIVLLPQVNDEILSSIEETDIPGMADLQSVR